MQLLILSNKSPYQASCRVRKDQLINYHHLHSMVFPLESQFNPYLHLQNFVDHLIRMFPHSYLKCSLFVAYFETKRLSQGEEEGF